MRVVCCAMPCLPVVCHLHLLSLSCVGSGWFLLHATRHDASHLNSYPWQSDSTCKHTLSTRPLWCDTKVWTSV